MVIIPDRYDRPSIYYVKQNQKYFQLVEAREKKKKMITSFQQDALFIQNTIMH